MLEAREKSANLEYTIFMRSSGRSWQSLYPTSATVSSGGATVDVLQKKV